LATAEACTADGFLRTGDVGVERPDGTFMVVGRLKEMFKSGGYAVYPREIEMALEAHPGVAAAAVVAVPDPVFHEVGAAFVVPRPGSGAGAEELVRHCRDRLAGHKVPKHVEIVEGLPLLPTGEVGKAALRRAFTPSPRTAERLPPGLRTAPPLDGRAPPGLPGGRPAAGGGATPHAAA